jgi:hypothetical protein
MTDDERRKPAPDASRLPSVEWGGYTPRREDVHDEDRNVPPDQIKAIESGRLTRTVTVPATRVVAFGLYGTTKRVSFRPRPDYRLIASEMTLAR